MEKRAIVTPADDNVSEMTKITHPIMKEYAKKVNASFLVLDHKASHIHYRILKLYKLLKKYDRIIVFDSDMLIRKDCPDLFDCVPREKIGTVLEDKGTRRESRLERIRKAQDKLGFIGWVEDYINTGVLVVSKEHRDIFKKRELYMDTGYDCIYLTYWIKKLGFEIFELPARFNCMRCFTEPWNGDFSRFDAWIIHYAGGGWTGNQLMNIKNDLTKWKIKNLI